MCVFPNLIGTTGVRLCRGCASCTPSTSYTWTSNQTTSSSSTAPSRLVGWGWSYTPSTSYTWTLSQTTSSSSRAPSRLVGLGGGELHAFNTILNTHGWQGHRGMVKGTYRWEIRTDMGTGSGSRWYGQRPVWRVKFSKVQCMHLKGFGECGSAVCVQTDR